MAPCARPSAALLLTVVVLSLAACQPISGASVIGFDTSFTSAASPFAVTECNAACASPGSVAFQLKLVRSGSLSATDTVYVSTRPPSDASLLAATAGDDYTAVANAAVVFAPNDASKTVTVTVVSDGIYEEDEFLEAVIQSPSTGVSLGTSAQVAYIKIQDGGDAGIFSFGASSFTFLENVGSVKIKVVRGGGASKNVTVTYRLSNQAQATAVNTKNFFLTDAIYQLTFLESQREAFIPLRIVNDDVYESQEFFYLELSALAPMTANGQASIAKLGTQRTAVVFIADDGDAGQFDFAAPSIFCREDNGSAVVSIVRSLGSSSSSYTPVTLTVTTAGTSGGSNATQGGSMAFDYLAASGKLTWANAETRKTFSVKVFNNKKYEPLARAFKIQMTVVDGGASIGKQSDIWVFIIDDRDAGTLSFKQKQYDVLENAGSVQVEIVRGGLTDSTGINTYTSGSVTVSVATYGGTIQPGKGKYDIDYDNGVVESMKCTHVSPCTAVPNVAYTALASTTVTFADGEKSKLVAIPILDDSLFEAPDQVFRVVIQNVTGGAHIGIDYEHPSEWDDYRAAFLALDKRRAELLDFVGTIVTIKDDGDAAMLVSKASLSVSEIGQTDGFDVWLNSAPSGDVTVGLSVDASALSLSVSTLTFTTSNWMTRQSVKVAAVANNRTQSLPSSAVSIAATSSDASYNAPLRTSLATNTGFVVASKIYTQMPGVYATGNPLHAFPWTESFGVLTGPQATAVVVAFVLDDDPAGLVMAPEGLRHLSASKISPDNYVAIRRAGHDATVSVTLASEPAENVDVTFTVGVDDGVKLTPTTLTFTVSNWNIAQQLTIQAVTSANPGIDDGVQFSSVAAIATSTADSFYNKPSDPMTRIFVERFPPALALLDASVLEIRENDPVGPGFAAYGVLLGSEPMHWEPEGSQQYNPFELTIGANADTTLVFSSDAAVATPAAGASASFAAASNSSSSTPTTRLVRVGVLRLTVNPAIAAATGSHQVGGAKLRLYRVSGGENGGLGGVSVGVAVASGSLAEKWDEVTLRAECNSINANVVCSFTTAAASSQPLTAMFPLSTSFLTLHDASAGVKTIKPTGTFDATTNAYVPGSGWVEIDVTVAVNSFLAKQHQLELAKQPFAKDLTLLVYTLAPSFFVYDGVTEAAFASKDHKDPTLRPQLLVLGSGRINLTLSASVAQSHPGNAKAAVDGSYTSNLGVASSFAMSSVPYKYPWWQADLGMQRIVDDVVVTVKKKASSASLTAAQLPVSLWLMLSDVSLSPGNSGLTGFTAAKTKALYVKQFNLSTRSFSAAESETIVLRWRVYGAQGDTHFGFDANTTTTVEARYLLLQVEGENNIVLNEVEIFQPALASARVSLGGYMPSVSVASKDKNQIALQLNQPGETTTDLDECDSTTAVCRRELLFTSGDWWRPKSVRVAVVDDAVATGDRDILLTHTLASSEPAFRGSSVCGGTDPCTPSLFNDSGVKVLRVRDDDENVVLLSSSQLTVEEGSGVYPSAPVVRQERRILPASVLCSDSPTRVLSSAWSRPATCANVFSDAAASTPWEVCIKDPSAATLAAGSAWVLAGFAGNGTDITEITFSVPQMKSAKYVQRLSLWWSDALDLNASSSSTLLDIAKSWTKIRSFDVVMTSSGSQTFRASGLDLTATRVLAVAFDKSYDDASRCLVAPSVTVRASVAVPFPLAVRGDLSSADSVPPSESGRSRMHQFGAVGKLQVRLASEPVKPVTVAVVADPDNAPLSVFDTANASTGQSLVDLVGGSYDSGERVAFHAPTSLVFTPDNWNVVQQLTFLAVDDNVFNGNRSFSVSHAVSSTEATAVVIPTQAFASSTIQRGLAKLPAEYAYEKAPFVVAYARQPAWPRNWKPDWISGRGTVDVSVVDDDLPGVTLSASTVVVSESATVPGNYSVTLDSSPTGDVVVTIQYELNDSLLRVEPLRLTFTATSWKTPQWVLVTPVPNDVYDAGAPLTIGYDRLVAKKSQPLLKHKVSSAKDPVYHALAVGTNEKDRETAYVARQGVVAVVLDDDTGCPKEFACLNGGVCHNVTYGGSVGTHSASVCACPRTFGMRNCGAQCTSERDCAFSRVEMRLKCRAGDATAVCGDSFSPAMLVATLYRMLTSNELASASGTLYPKLSLGAMADVLYLVNATTTPCVETTEATAVCVKATMDITRTSGSTSNPAVDKLQAYLESGPLQAQPIFAELLTETQQYPQNLSATIAVWVFVSFCVACMAAVTTLFSVRCFKTKRFHVKPELGDDAVGEAMPLQGSKNVRAR